MDFNLYGSGDYTKEIVFTETILTDYFNLKNKAEGARRYGYRNEVSKYTNGAGEVAYRFELQTTLDGSRYQSSKYGDWCPTQEAAEAALKKSVAGALKRYAKLAQDPASKIEHRPS